MFKVATEIQVLENCFIPSKIYEELNTLLQHGNVTKLQANIIADIKRRNSAWKLKTV